MGSTSTDALLYGRQLWDDGLFLKGQCHDIFDPRFFFKSINPPRTLIHVLKPFRIWLRIRRDIRFGNSQNRIPRSQWDRGIWLFVRVLTFSSNYMYVMFTDAFAFAIVYHFKENRSPLSFSRRIQRSHWDRGIRTLRTIISNISANSKLRICETAQGSIVRWKNGRSKIAWHCPFGLGLI
jgi:hypothetical protein